ncbi:trypsin-like peptidase domain-containing protein [Streptomyces sp. NPDC012935]|uniref:S1C family serine protease n=1 Tax=Streptomyces sp. NPDC012935 TaxID=3364857 RepID=UPI0036AF64DE
MNEGKPAKAKWWNRPRPQGPSAEPEGAAPTPGDLSEPTAPAGDAGDDGARGHRADTDGDFELALPAVSDGRGGTSAQGDFELARPAVGAAGDATSTEGDFELRPAVSGSGGDGASAETDFELRPAVSGSGGDGASAETDFVLARPAAHVDGAGDGEAASGEGRFEQARPTGAPAPAPEADVTVTAAGAADDERPEPLHAPDPYSTPPYGEPGPWAPAPPVQHPATTPAPGTAVPSPPPSVHGVLTPAPGTAVPSPPPPTHGVLTPAPGTAVPSPPPSVHGVLTPAPGTAVPSPPPSAHGVPTPAPGTAVPSPPPSAHGVLTPASGAAASTTGTEGTAHTAPGPPVPPSPSGAEPAPAPPPALSATVTAAPPGIPAQTPPPATGTATRATPAPTADTPAPANPWQNYDPWSRTPHAPHTTPLQQNGATGVTGVPSRKRGRKALLVGALLLALVSGGVGGVVGASLERNGGVGAVELPQAGSESAGRAPDSVAGIAARALPSVVTLHVSGSEEQGTGTGFVLDDRGHILTNNHVVEPAGDDGEISVTFHSGDTAKATVVGRDGGYDLAVVKVTGVSGLAPLPLGNSDNVQVGDPVVAIGAPFDLAGTVTSGIVSAKERPITAGGESGDGSDMSYVDALQTDAPINPGNSGGPLLDAQGRVVGINSAIRSADSGSDLDGGQAGSIGLGFAIPVNQAKRVAEELINTGRATHPVIGVTLDMGYTGDGARVGTKGSDGGPAVTAGGPGAKAGIKSGDVITEVNGQRVHSGEELIVKTRAHRPGDRLELTLERGGKEISIPLTLGSSSGG